MPKASRDYRAVHAAARRLEPQMARALRRALAKIRDSVSINDLALALAAKDQRRALALLPRAAVEDALMAAGNVKAEAMRRGRQVGREQAKKAAA